MNRLLDSFVLNLARYGLKTPGYKALKNSREPTSNLSNSPLEMPCDQGKHKSLGKNLTVGFASCHNGFTRQGKSPSH